MIIGVFKRALYRYYFLGGKCVSRAAQPIATPRYSSIPLPTHLYSNPLRDASRSNAEWRIQTSHALVTERVGYQKIPPSYIDG